MSSPNPETPDPQPTTNPSDHSTRDQNPVDPEPDRPKDKGEDEVLEEEEEGECGFCLFMKAGGCKESFVAWETCVDDAEKKGDDIAAKCMEVTGALKKCMEDHADYYEPILRAEKAAHEEAIREFEKEKAVKDSEQNLESKEDDLKKNRGA